MRTLILLLTLTLVSSCGHSPKREPKGHLVGTVENGCLYLGYQKTLSCPFHGCDKCPPRRKREKKGNPSQETQTVIMWA